MREIEVFEEIEIQKEAKEVDEKSECEREPR